MKILPGTPKEFANETPTSLHLSKFLVSNPAILPQVATMYDANDTAFSSLLARRNMFNGKVADPFNPKSMQYKVIGNRKVMWDIKGFDERKMRISQAYNCDSFPTQPGKNGSWIDIYADINWASPRDVMELGDNRTQLFVADSMLPQEVEADVWHYRCRIQTNDRSDYVDPSLLAVGAEMSVIYTAFEELSETAYEKYTFDEKAYTHLTIQRLKWSISGTADEYKANAVWMEHNGVKVWADMAQMKMLKRAVKYRERQLIYGRSTVAANDEVLQKTSEGFDVLAGDGIVNQGDGAWRLPYNVLNLKVIDSILENVSLYSNAWGTEVAAICGYQWYRNFTAIMKDQAGVESKVVEMNGSKKGINLDYEHYTLGGVKIIPTMARWFDSPERASTYGADGTRNTSHNAIFTALGDIEPNNPAIELLALGKRSWLEGEVNGINKGGDMANSVDGKHHHILWETGAALKDINGIAELYRSIV